MTPDSESTGVLVQAYMYRYHTPDFNELKLCYRIEPIIISSTADQQITYTEL